MIDIDSQYHWEALCQMFENSDDNFFSYSLSMSEICVLPLNARVQKITSGVAYSNAIFTTWGFEKSARVKSLVDPTVLRLSVS